MHETHPILRLQRTIGNQALLSQSQQPESENVAKTPNFSQPTTVPLSTQEVLHSPGQPLDAATRAFMEPCLGHDFSRVRVHTDTQAAESTRGMNALAYTVGRHIVFGADQYNPNSRQGRHLLTHELSHVVQQSTICDVTQQKPTLGPTSDIYEREAEQTAGIVAAINDSDTRHSNTPLISPPTDLKPKHRLGSPIVQRVILPGVIWDPKVVFQSASQIAQTLTYNQAVSQLQSIDPTIHNYLSAVSPGGGPTTIKSGQAPTDTPSISLQFTFNLETRFATLSGNQLAKFTGGDPTLTTSGNPRVLTANMVIEIAPVSGANALTSLAKSLFHEGVHMVLFMEQLISSSPPSPHLAALVNYRRIARQHKEHSLLLAELEVFIELDWQIQGLNPPSGQSRKGAQEIMDHLIEEKYVFDQEKQHFKSQFTNRGLALTYIMEGFQNLDVRANRTDRNVRSIVDKATSILGEIDSQIRPQPSSTQP